MSNALAIATVTTALAKLVEDAALTMVSGAKVEISRPNSTANSSNRIHLFLYQVIPNGAMRNNDLPMRSSDGRLVQRPTVALDLHYLMAFYGDTEQEAQMMLGAVIRDLNAQPVLTKQMILDVTSPPFLNESDLAKSVEQVKFTPIPVSLEELSKLWSVFFQTPYALSVAYHASVVLIESEESAQTPLPVLRRGEWDQGVDVLLGPFPSLDNAYYGMPDDRILQARPPSLPAAQLGLAVIIKGQNLGGNVFLRFHHSREELVNELQVMVENRSPTELKVLLPVPGTASTQTDWAPGVYTVTAVKPSQTGGRDITSNALPISLAPIIAEIEVLAPNITITCQPRVQEGQQAGLLLAGREIAGKIDANDADKVVFDIAELPPVNNELLRLRVDGIESMPFRRVDTPPPSCFEFDPDQRVTIT